MAPVTELCRIFPKEGQEAELEAVLADTSITLLEQPGVEGVYTSATLEKDNPLHLLIVEWDSIDSHKAFESKTDIYKPFVQKLLPVLASPPIVYHTSFSPEHPPVLHNAEGKGGAKSAVAELLHLYFPTGDAFTADQMAATAKNYREFLGHLPGNAAGHTGEAAGGWTVEELEFKGEKVRAFVVAIGWDSLEAHMEYRKTEHFAKHIPLVRGLEGLKGVEVFHVSTKGW